jgi:hypothetical protein
MVGLIKNKSMMIIYALAFTIVASLVWLWVGGMDFMKKSHPDYKGEDFLNWDQDVNKVAGRDGWDENLHDEIY